MMSIYDDQLSLSSLEDESSECVKLAIAMAHIIIIIALLILYMIVHAM